MKIAICDPDAFYPLRTLVEGPFESLSELSAIERFIRTVVLHDTMVMELVPHAYDPEADFEFTEEEKRAGGRNVILAFGPTLKGFDFFADPNWCPPMPQIELNSSLVNIASNFANAGEGNIYFNAHVDFLKRVLGIVRLGGSALVCSDFGKKAIATAETYPEALFHELDEEWKKHAQLAQRDGFGLLVPPMLSIVLSRCARREAIPVVIRDLRDEWAVARRKVWDRLDAMRTSKTLGEFLQIEHELSQASRQFSPHETERDSRPGRILWDIIGAATAGAGVAKITGKSPGAGAITGAIAQSARSVPAFLHEFGSSLFSRGAFDLAGKIRSETSEVEHHALSRLLTNAEKQKLNLA